MYNTKQHSKVQKPNQLTSFTAVFSSNTSISTVIPNNYFKLFLLCSFFLFVLILFLKYLNLFTLDMF